MPQKWKIFPKICQFLPNFVKKWPKYRQNIKKYRQVVQKLPFFGCIGVVLVLQEIFFISYWSWVDFLPQKMSLELVLVWIFRNFFLLYWSRDGFFGQKFWILVLGRPDQNPKCSALGYGYSELD